MVHKEGLLSKLIHKGHYEKVENPKIIYTYTHLHKTNDKYFNALGLSLTLINTKNKMVRNNMKK